MNSSRNKNRQNCNGNIDGEACTNSLSCSRRFCSECGQANPLYSKASAVSNLETDSNTETGQNTDTSVSEDDEFHDAIDSQNNAQTPIEEQPLMRLNDTDPNKDNDIFDSSSDDEEITTGNKNTREADLEGVLLYDRTASVDPTDDCESHSTQMSSDQIMKYLKQKLTKDGPIETKKYINKMLHQWKRASVKIAITGSKQVGKSTFINMIRNVTLEDDGYAKSGSGDTTMKITEYFDPKNSRIIYCDCPGVGSLRMTRCQFLEKVDLSSFDYILIFYKDVLSTEDAWIAEQLTILNKPFCLVRSMLDQDIENEKHDKPDDKRMNEVEIVKEIREKAKLSMETDSKFKDAKLFVISCRKPHLGEMSACLKHLTATLPEAKYQAIMFALPVSSQQVIEDKYEELKKRIPLVAVGAGIACGATIFPGIGKFIVQNPIIKKEVQRYLKTFVLTEEQIKKLPDVLTNENIPVESTADVIIRYIVSLPLIIGPGIEGGLRVKDILSKTLDSMRLHAYTVHGLCLAPKRFKQSVST